MRKRKIEKCLEKYVLNIPGYLRDIRRKLIGYL